MPRPNMVNIPPEVLHLIFQHLPQQSLHAIMITNSNFVELAAPYLYKEPIFASTYRYAQFAWTVRHNKHYADLVRILDLSKFVSEEPDGIKEPEPIAGWREFKYRNQGIYGAHQIVFTESNGSTHPAPSPFLKSFHQTRDIPVGGLCQVLVACKKLKKVNLSHLQLAPDFLISPSDDATTSDPNSSRASSEPIYFISDIPKSWTWGSNELLPIYPDLILTALISLTRLEEFLAKKSLWLTTGRVERLLREAGESLRWVDFRGASMQKGVKWTVEGRREEVERIVGRELRVLGSE